MPTCILQTSKPIKGETNMSTTTASPNIPARQVRRIPTWLKIAIGIIALIVIALAIMISGMSFVPTDLNTATTRLTDDGLFQISYTPQLEPLGINQMHTWTIQVQSVDGQPVESAEITVDGGMPQHGHGLPTAPQVTQYLGGGDYLVEGMRFNMPGWWVVTFQISHDGQSDIVTFNLILD
jgi:hypothetical protein